MKKIIFFSYLKFQILGMFAKLRKVTQLRHICPSLYMEQLGSQWKEFHEIWYLGISRKSVKTVKVSLKYGKNNRYFT
jgi:hypothetical protein